MVTTDARLSDARTPTAHASSHATAGADPVTVAESQVTGLTAALAAKAPLASPALTDTPTAPTAAQGTNTTQVATTAYVQTEAALLVPKSLYDANSILAATTDNVPAALTVAASRIVGRKSTGDIAALTADELKTLLAYFAWEAGAMPLIIGTPTPLTGQYVAAAADGGSHYTTANGEARAQPVYLRAGTLDRIACEVVTPGGTGSVVRLGIYSSDAAGQPSSRLLDAGTVDGTTAAVKEITISQAVTAGVYWLVAVHQGASTPIASVRYGNTVGTAQTLTATAASAVAGTSTYPCRLMSGVTGALPATFTASGLEQNPSRVAVRYA